MPRRPVPAIERFLVKVNIDPTGCWEWTAFVDRDGYGLFGESKGRTVRAMRFAYEQLVGPIPEGLHLDHLCRNRRCVRPSHLEPVTLAVNNSRGAKAQATHCRNGHEFTEANTYVKPNGCRACKACHRERERASKERRAEASRRYRENHRPS
jgi:hypothetical protein